MPYQWRFDVVWEHLPFLLAGLGMTVLMTVLAMLGGLALGLVVALSRLGPWRPLQALAYGYTELFRTTPLLVQIIWIFYVLPLLTGIVLSPFASGLLALSLNVAAFVSEIYRAGITSIGPGQRQAGFALGMTPAQCLRRIILPQAVTRVIPPLASTWVSLFKDTSILAAIGVTELMFRARYMATETFRPLEIFTVAALVYFAITYPQSLAVNQLYRRFRTLE
ncbi:MAG: amino acid ABC transporter permease [Candidatus Rokubacteria bacterium]|nr:amino acid ABC transporter permease [Candidatus Rokubacteria bacterium]